MKPVIVPIAITIVLVVFLGFLVFKSNNSAKASNSERFFAGDLPAVPAETSVATNANASANPGAAASGIGGFSPSDPLGDEVYNPIEGAESAAAPASSCFPRDRLSASDLLPKDAANSKWAQMNPAGQGDVRDQNFLTAGWHTGINTVGQSLRNANLQLRSEPPNPQVAVSPWNIATIGPDTNRRALEIGGDW